MKSIDFVIPVLDEEKTLKNKVYEAVEALNEHFKNDHWRLIIVDNGSQDRTYSIAENLSCEIAEVSCLKLHEKGLGLALDKAWSESKADYVGYFDLDLSTNPKHFEHVRNLLFDKNVDVVYGSRHANGALVEGRSMTREVTSRCFNFILRSYFKLNISDGMCGFKFLTYKSFLEIKKNGLNNTGWFYPAELIIRAKNLNMDIAELPIHWIDDRDSKVKVLKLSLLYLAEMIRLKSSIKNQA